MRNVLVIVGLAMAMPLSASNINDVSGLFKDSSKNPQSGETAKKHWYETFTIRGYAHIRYNRFLETNENLKCEMCDRSIGKNQGIFIRRARTTISGDLNSHTFIYMQADWAQAIGNPQNFLQIRDLYVDYAFDKKKEFRVRLGQSKVTFGYDNMQSSQIRLPLDRTDAMNSAAPNERDLGAYFFWASERARKIYAENTKNGMKGAGDYGIFAFGVYNGQTANRPEMNNNRHVVARINYPFTFGNQVLEVGAQAYRGLYYINTDQTNAGVKLKANRNYLDERTALSVALQPKPFGIQAEYTLGKGPEINPARDSIIVKNLKGGYVLLSYNINYKTYGITPFVRWQFYKGGKKLEMDARSYDIKEFETGVEWRVNSNFELTVQYTISDRRYEDFVNKVNHQKGNFLRLQVQFNY